MHDETGYPEGGRRFPWCLVAAHGCDHLFGHEQFGHEAIGVLSVLRWFQVRVVFTEHEEVSAVIPECCGVTGPESPVIDLSLFGAL